MPTAIEDLLTILDLEPIEENIFRGISPDTGWQRVFGGLVVAQALVAAMKTVPQRPPHSLHAYFLLAGEPKTPILYEVERIRDGSSFSTRRCVAIQHGRAIFSLSASFQIEETGAEHAIEKPDVPEPESLLSEEEILARFGSVMPEAVRRYFERERPIELRPVDLTRYSGGSRINKPPRQYVWVKASGKLPDDPSIHRAILAYLSDLTLLDTALIPHGLSVFDGQVQVASLDHALWFHRPFRADEWLLYAQDSPSAGGARGFTRGEIFTREGLLVASVAQEGLMRPRAPRE